MGELSVRDYTNATITIHPLIESHLLEYDKFQ